MQSDPVACVPDGSLAAAELALSRGELLRAERLASQTKDSRCPGEQRQASRFEADLAAALGESSQLDPFGEISAARSASNEKEARTRFGRAARALEVQTGQKAKPLFLRLINHEEDGRGQQARPVPRTPFGDRVVFDWRQPDLLEPVRLVDAAELLGSASDRGASLVWSSDEARLLRPRDVADIPLGAVPERAVAKGRRDRWLVTCVETGTLRVFDARTARPQRELASSCPDKMIVASDHRLIAFDDEKMTVMALPSLEPLGQIAAGYFEKWALAESGASFVLAEWLPGEDETRLVAIDLETAKQSFSTTRAQLMGLEFTLSPNGKKLLLVDDTATVIDLPTQRITSLGGRVHYPFRPISLAKNGWGDTYTPPAATGAVAVMDDGRACIEQGGTPALLPRSTTEHCSIGPRGVEVGRASSTGKTRWVLPPKHTDDDQRTVLVATSIGKVFRLERDAVLPKECGMERNFDGTMPPCPPVQTVVVYDAKSGREQARHPIGAPFWPTLGHISKDGATLFVVFEAGGENPGTLREIDLGDGERGPQAPDDPFRPIWHLISLDEGLIRVLKQPAGVTQRWDPSSLARVGRDARGAGPLPPRLDFVEVDESLVASVQGSDSTTRTEIGTLVPMEDGLAVFFEDGTLELIDVPSPPSDLVCAFGNVLAPFELCAHLLVEGVYRARVADASLASGEAPLP